MAAAGTGNQLRSRLLPQWIGMQLPVISEEEAKALMQQQGEDRAYDQWDAAQLLLCGTHVRVSGCVTHCGAWLAPAGG